MNIREFNQAAKGGGRTYAQILTQAQDDLVSLGEQWNDVAEALAAAEQNECDLRDRQKELQRRLIAAGQSYDQHVMKSMALMAQGDEAAARKERGFAGQWSDETQFLDSSLSFLVVYPLSDAVTEKWRLTIENLRLQSLFNEASVVVRRCSAIVDAGPLWQKDRTLTLSFGADHQLSEAERVMQREVPAAEDALKKHLRETESARRSMPRAGVIGFNKQLRQEAAVAA